MEFAEKLETWYAENGRALPWRETRDPYRIWISEIILQQTRVSQGLDYYKRFVERFPTVEALALASQDEVMRQWEGLGYYSRARNMHAAAAQIVAEGGFPSDYAGVRALKGIGDYTAAAICSFAYNLPTAVVDGNVYRVLSRYFGVETPIDSTKGKKVFAELASELLDTKRPALYNQAIMDFGALQCVPKSPRCKTCVLADACCAFAAGKVELLPVKSKKTAVKTRHFSYLIILDEGKTYIHRRGDGDIWNGLYEPLLIETDAKNDEISVVPEGYCVVRELRGLRHQLTHRTIVADALLVKKENAAVCDVLPDDYFSVAIEDLANFAAPKLVNIIYERLLDL